MSTKSTKIKKKKKKPRNKFEQRLDAQLENSGVSYEYESLKLPYTIEGTYNPDWHIKHNDIIIEGKGHFRPEAMRKMVAVKKMHPHLDIRIVFYSANKKYIKWANKYGFPYAIGSIPEEWLK